MMKDLKNIKYWLFDLDNTLYSGDTKVFDQVDKKMSKFISEKLKVSQPNPMWSPDDRVNSPSHYTSGKREVIDTIEDAVKDAPSTIFGML